MKSQHLFHGRTTLKLLNAYRMRIDQYEGIVRDPAPTSLFHHPSPMKSQVMPSKLISRTQTQNRRLEVFIALALNKKTLVETKEPEVELKGPSWVAERYSLLLHFNQVPIPYSVRQFQFDEKVDHDKECPILYITHIIGLS